MYTATYQLGTDYSNSAFVTSDSPVGFVDPAKITGASSNEKSLYFGGFTPSVTDAPLGGRVLRISVPENGTYHLSLTLTNDSSVATDNASKVDDPGIRIYTGRRALRFRDISFDGNETKNYECYVHVAPYYPAMSGIAVDEKAIYITVLGAALILAVTVTSSDVPTFFIAGDSTLTDQNAPIPYTIMGSCGGWAQLLSLYADQMAVNNQAHSGMTTNCFRDDGHLDIVKNYIKKGDYVLLQFGHNDQKRRNLAAFGGYIENLKWYVDLIRSYGANPIIASPISRIPSEDDEGFYSLLADHAKAAKEAAEEKQCPFIDLHSFTFDKWMEFGDMAPKYFCRGDITHTNDFGAELIARYVVEQLVDIIPSTASLIKDKSEWPTEIFPTKDSDFPPAPKNAEPFVPPFSYNDVSEDRPDYDELVAALRLGMLDPCVMYLHPDDYMPRAQALMPFFKAIRKAGIRPYEGRFSDIKKHEWDSGYIQALVNYSLIDYSTIEGDKFRPDDPMTYGEYASLCMHGLGKVMSVAESLNAAINLNLLKKDAKENDTITRAECYVSMVRLMDILGNQNAKLPSDAEVHPVG